MGLFKLTDIASFLFINPFNIDINIENIVVKFNEFRYTEEETVDIKCDILLKLMSLKYLFGSLLHISTLIWLRSSAVLKCENIQTWVTIIGSLLGIVLKNNGHTTNFVFFVFDVSTW